MCAGAVTHVAVVSSVMRMSKASFTAAASCSENLGEMLTPTSVGADVSAALRRYTPRPCTPFTVVLTTSCGRGGATAYAAASLYAASTCNRPWPRPNTPVPTSGMELFSRARRMVWGRYARPSAFKPDSISATLPHAFGEDMDVPFINIEPATVESTRDRQRHEGAHRERHPR